MLHRTRWLTAFAFGVTVVGLPVARVCAGEPEIVQTYGMDLNPTSISVSPTGNKIIWCLEDRLVEYRLNANGHIRERTNRLQEERFFCCSYTPGGRRIVAACTRQVLVIPRDNWDNATVLETPQSDPRALCCLESPPVALVQWRHQGAISVVNYRNPAVRNTIDFTWPGDYDGRGVMAHPDGRRFYRIVCDESHPQKFGKIDFMRDPLGMAEVLWSEAVGDPWGLGLGPDPQHVMVASKFSRQLDIFGLDTGERTPWYYLDTQYGMGVATTSDGYYVVVADYTGVGLYIISGHDLRALLDPNSGMDRTEVRYTTFALPDYAISLALHPTLPLAYVGCQPSTRGDPSRIYVVRLGIPGVEHPDD